MDYQPTGKMQNYKTPRRLIRQEKSLDNHDYGNDILDMASKGQSMKKNQQLDFIKIKNVGSAKGTVKKLRKKKKPQTAGKYLEKQLSRRLQKTNLNQLYSGDHLHSIYIVVVTISYPETI